LAQLSEQVVDRLDPERVLVVNLGLQNRGDFAAHRFDKHGRRVFHVNHPGGFDSAVVGAFLERLDHALGFETFYDAVFPNAMTSYGVRSHLLAMPELYNPRAPELQADDVWIPTALGPHDGRRLRAQVLPWWCPVDTVPERVEHDGPIRFVHVTGSAMQDRNGTRSLVAACAHVTVPCELVIVGTQQPFGDDARIGHVTVTRIARTPCWCDWLTLGDVLVMPRRYGWLSMPAFEAAAAGLPVVCCDRFPEHEWFGDIAPGLLVPTVGGPVAVPMKGGQILVSTAHPEYLAMTMDELASDPEKVTAYGRAFREWAEAHDWESVKAQWFAALR
jgi:hypothetical protein